MEHVIRQREGNTNLLRRLWNALRMLGDIWNAPVNANLKCNVFKASVQGALLSGLCAFLHARMGALQRMNSSR